MHRSPPGHPAPAGSTDTSGPPPGCPGPGRPAIAAAALLAGWFVAVAALAGEAPVVRVGIYDNPPKVFVDEVGRPTGFWPELTRVIAAEEGWRIDWVNGSWSQGMERLAEASIDVLVDVGVTRDRDERFRFGAESVHVSWSRVYAARGAGIETIPDLQGKRIGGLAGSFNLSGPEGIEQIIRDFGLQAEVVALPSYREVFRALEAGELDAAVTNRDFGNRMEAAFAVERTPIIFQPAELRYAFPRGSPAAEAFLAGFDRQLARLKQDRASAFYGLQAQWLGIEETKRETVLPPWLQSVLLGLGALVALISAALVVIERRVIARTRELRERSADLRRNRDQLAESQRMADVGSWRRRLDTGVIEWSDQACRIMGVSPATFTPTLEGFFALVHPDDRERVRLDHEGSAAGEHRSDIDYRVVRPDGEVRIVHEIAERRYDDHLDTAVFAGTVQDVTQRRGREDRLELFQRLLEQSDEYIVVIDDAYRFVLSNEAYARLYCLAREAIEGAPVAEIVGDEWFRGQVKPSVDRALAGHASSFELQRAYPGIGETRAYLVRCFPIRDGAAGVRQVGVVLTDLSELRAAEAAVAEQAQLLAIAGRAARLGGWWYEPDEDRITGSETVAEITGWPAARPFPLTEVSGLGDPGDAGRFRDAIATCARHGTPFDLEWRLAGTGGAADWVRVIGERVERRDRAGWRVQGAIQDISDQKMADAALEQLNERLRDILESITDAFLTIDRDGRLDYVNERAAELLGGSVDSLVGEPAMPLLPAGLRARLEGEVHHALDARVPVALEGFHETSGRWLELRLYPTADGVALYLQDITERHELVERLREQEGALRRSRDEASSALAVRQALINALPAQLALLDAEGRVLDVNSRWRQFARERPAADAECGVGASYLEICDTATGAGAEYARRAAAGLRAVLAGERATFALEYPCDGVDEDRWFRLTVSGLDAAATVGGHPGAVVMHVDISERKRAERELRRLAFQDPLTGLYSRVGFTAELDAYLESRPWQEEAMVVMLNVRNQRDVNDAHGHAAGDRLLTEVATRLAASVGGDTILARPGGDEFAAFLPAATPEHAAAQREAVAAVFSEPFRIDGITLQLGAYLGFTRLGERRRPAEELVREAAIALFRERQARRANTWGAFTPMLDEERLERVELTRALQQALRRGEFELHFQPKVRLDNGELVASEALLRWVHPERGLLSPARFIPVAEQSQLIGPIGDWVLREACAHLRAWQDAGLDVVRVSVNVSLVQFAVGDFTATVRDALDAYAIDPDHLTLEITESVFESESEALYEQLQALHAAGVRLSLDDFGTGYSSLLYLQRYPFDEIKVDQGFVRGVLEEEYNRRIVRMVLGLAETLGAETVAEGIETAAVRDAVVAMGCRVGQGYHYSMPLAPDDFRWLLGHRACLPLQAGGDDDAASAPTAPPPAG